MEPLQSGGGQERGMRSGTVPAPLAVGMGAACEIARTEMDVSKSKNHCIQNYKIHTIFHSTITNISTSYRII